LSTDDAVLLDGISLYPNPTRGSIQLAYTGSQALQSLTITDVLGKTVQQISLINFDGLQTVDVSRLRSGLYFFTITGTQNTATQRVIVQ